MEKIKKGHLFYFTKQLSFTAIVLFLLSNCTPQNKFYRDYVAEQVKTRTMANLRTGKDATLFEIPPSIYMSDGLTEEEAVALALWNNPQFQADLVTVSIAQADLIDAGVIPNPLLRYIAPWGTTFASGYINFYLEALWQRPKRIAAAKIEAQRVAENMVQRSFVLIRDAQVAYTDFLLARRKQAILTQNFKIRSQIAALAKSRFRNGDISRWELNIAQSDSATAADIFNRGAQDTTIFKSRLNALLGFRNVDTTVTLRPANLTAYTPLTKEQWQQQADEIQPELRSARANMEAVGSRLGWERSRVFNFAATINMQTTQENNPDANKGNKSLLPNAFAPGIQAEIPLFNRNQGRIARSTAEIEQAALQYISIKQRLNQQLSEAYARYQISLQSYQTYNSKLIPTLEETLHLSTSAYTNGDISYLPVLEANRQLLEAQLRRAEVEAEVRRAISQLQFILGYKN